MRARRAVLAYFTKSDFVREPSSNKTPNALGERLNVLREPQKVSGRSNSGNPKQRFTCFQVEADSQGQAAGDAMENVAAVLIRLHKDMEIQDISPPSCAQPHPLTIADHLTSYILHLTSYILHLTSYILHLTR